MRDPKQESLTVQVPADAAFQAALGLAQNTKRATILAAHNQGRKLAFREKGAMSNPKFTVVSVEDAGSESVVRVTVGTDPRSPKALLDGKFNDKSLKKFVESLQGAIDGSAPVQTTPVANHYLQKKTEVPWEDPNEEPQVELDGNFLALYGR